MFLRAAEYKIQLFPKISSVPIRVTALGVQVPFCAMPMHLKNTSER
jgi:hypothetical protein